MRLQLALGFCIVFMSRNGQDNSALCSTLHEGRLSEEGTAMNDIEHVKRPINAKRNRMYFIIGAIIVLLFAGGFAYETVKALQVRSLTGAVFNTYVINHGIGTADITDDASGFQQDFCVLHLKQPIPEKQLLSETMSLMYRYNDLDGGTTLSIRYNENGKSITQADAVYNVGTETVLVTLNEGANKRVVKQHVNWAGGEGAS